MAKKPTIIEEIPDVNYAAFRRREWFENSKIAIQIFLMWILAAALLVFLMLTIMAGTTTLLPETEGVTALRHLFVEIASNAKTVVLFALGFFFREYINGKSISEN